MIKFKFIGKRKDTGEWITGNIFNPESCIGGVYICPKASYADFLPDFEDGDDIEDHRGQGSALGHFHEVVPETVGISTGETDTNAEEIYSGHIIKCPKGRNDVIEFKNAGFWLKHRNCTLHHFLYTLRSEVEVIGNIHINPELAEV